MTTPIEVGDTVRFKDRPFLHRTGTVTALDPFGWWVEVEWQKRIDFNPGKRREAIGAVVRMTPGDFYATMHEPFEEPQP